MKKNILFLTGFLVLFLFSSKTTENKWETYTFEDASFSVEFPAEPEIKERKSTYSVKAKSDEATYQVSYSKTAKEKKSDMLNILLESGLDAFIKGMKERSKTTVESTKNITVLAFPGKEARLKINTESGITVTVLYRIIVSNQRTFQFSIIRAYDYIDDEQAAKFFDSFNLSEN